MGDVGRKGIGWRGVGRRGVGWRGGSWRIVIRCRCVGSGCDVRCVAKWGQQGFKG